MPPAPTLMVPFLKIPRVSSEVLVVSRAVPMPTAGDGAAGLLEELEEPEELELAVDELLDDDVELPAGCSALCTAATSWELTRFKAVPLAMLARPFDKLTIALPITLIRAVLACWA